MTGSSSPPPSQRRALKAAAFRAVTAGSTPSNGAMCCVASAACKRSVPLKTHSSSATAAVWGLSGTPLHCRRGAGGAANGQGCRRREGTPEAVGQAVGGGCQSGWGRLLPVTNAVEAGTWRQGDRNWPSAGRPRGEWGSPLPLPMQHPWAPEHRRRPWTMRHTASHRVRMNRPSTGGSLLPFAGRCWPSVRRGATAALCPATPAVTRQPEPQPPFQNPRNRPDVGGDGVSPASARPAALKEDWSLRETPSYPRPPCAQVLGPHASHRPHKVPPTAGHVGSSNHVRTGGGGGGGRQPQPIWTTSVSQAKHCSEEETAKPRQADAHNSSHFTFSPTFRVQPSFLSLIPPLSL